MKGDLIKIKKILKITLIIIAILVINFLIIANTVQAINLNTANIISGGDCGSLLKYRGIIVKVYYAQYEYNGVIYPAYCLDKTKQGVTNDLSYSVSVEDAITDVKLWRYIVNGYPYKSIEELGCANKEEAFTATKQAIYCYIHGNRVEDYEPIGEAGQRTLNALKKIVSDAENSTETKISNSITIERVDKKFTQDQKEKEYISKQYKLNYKGEITDYIVNINSKNLEGIKITDINNNEKSTFRAEEVFKVLIPIKNLTTKQNFSINIETKVKTKPIFYGKAQDSTYQDYALTAATYEDSIENISEEISENYTKIKIVKQEQETKERLKGVEFNILDANKNIVYSGLKTNENGEIEVSHIIPGKYYLQEIKTNDGYIENDKLIEIDVKLNEIFTVTVNNLKEDTPEEEKGEKEVEITVEKMPEETTPTEKQKEIRKLPITGY